MLPAEYRESICLIRRWDIEPSAFWEAIKRIEAELRYDPEQYAVRLPQSGRLVRMTVTKQGLMRETRTALLKLLSQLPVLLPALEYLLITSDEEALARIEFYVEFFKCVGRQIDLSDFPLDESADMETYSIHADALSRAMLLKSEIVLIVGQFELLRRAYFLNLRKHSSFRIKDAA